jgi:hypothetical protein
MKIKLHSISSIFLFTFIFLHSTTYSSAQPTNYATLPFHEGFESGVLDSNWYKTSSNAAGRIKIWPTDSLIWGGDTAFSVAGNKFLGMDMPTGGTFNLNEAWLGLNTTGASNLFFSFWWSDWNDETSPDDGIYISQNAGVTFVKVLSLMGANNPDLNWVYYNLNLDSINLAYGLNYGPNYVIKFQQYDDYYFAGGNDGFLFDEINIEALVTGNQDVLSKSFSVFPNPFNGEINISNTNKSESVSINVLNALGQNILSQTFNNQSLIKLPLEVEAGLYFLEIISENNRQVKQIIKK